MVSFVVLAAVIIFDAHLRRSLVVENCRGQLRYSVQEFNRHNTPPNPKLPHLIGL
jgi:hypothetical protein